MQLQPTWAEANLAMAKMIMTKAKADGNEGRYPAAIKFLKTTVDNCPKIGAEPFYWLGTQYYIIEDYPNTITYLTKYLNYDTDDPKKLGADYEFNSGQSTEMLRWSKFYVDIKITHVLLLQFLLLEFLLLKMNTLPSSLLIIRKRSTFGKYQ